MPAPAWITRLAREGDVPRSQVTRESEWALTQLLALGLASEEVQGARRRVVARDVTALGRWVTSTYPPAAEAPVPGLRARNIARARQSKAGASTHEAQPLLLRWFEPDAGAPLADLTTRLGLVGLTTDRVGALHPSEPWMLLTVENWESFLATSYGGCTETVVVAYIGGNIADATIRAIASIQPPPQRALHFGDYDWAGLAIYRRMRTVLPTLQLYIPAEIDILFTQFADPGLLTGQIPLTAQADDPPEVHEVITRIARHNAGLEQEIVAPPSLSR